MSGATQAPPNLRRSRKTILRRIAIRGGRPRLVPQSIGPSDFVINHAPLGPILPNEGNDGHVLR